MKLTKARRRALEWFRDNDGAKFFPVGIPRRVISELVALELLDTQKPEFGFVRYFITDAGRLALSEAEEGQGNG